MRSRTLSILVSLILIGAGVGFVRPYFERRIDESWASVCGTMQRVPPKSGEWVDLEEGDHLVFLDGPAGDELWNAPKYEGAMVDVLDHGGRPLKQRTDVDYTYDVNGRRGEALVRVKVRYPDSYSLRVTGPELAERDFVVALHELDPVQEQRRNAAKWRFGLWGALGGIGLCVLVLLGHRE